MTQYITNAEYRAAKSALTRVVNKLGQAQSAAHSWHATPEQKEALVKAANAVIDEVNKRFSLWNKGDYAYPDDWARWERARDDAYYAKQRADW